MLRLATDSCTGRRQPTLTRRTALELAGHPAGAATGSFEVGRARGIGRSMGTWTCGSVGAAGVGRAVGLEAVGEGWGGKGRKTKGEKNGYEFEDSFQEVRRLVHH